MNKNLLLKIGLAAMLIVLIGSIGIGAWVYRARSQDKSEVSTLNQNDVMPDLPNLEEEFKKADTDTTPLVLYSGSFIKIDSLHYGNGDVELISTKDGKAYLRFKTNTDIASGPDLFVYMSEKQDYNKLDTAKTLNLGKLKSNKGEQIYEITPEQLKKYDGAVVIWCKAFGVQFSRAEFKFQLTR
jgi:hypothetical protein